MEIDNNKAINYLLFEKFIHASDRVGLNFNEWCKMKKVTTTNPNIGLICKSCGKELDEIALKETGLCTACFTSNA